MFDAYLHDRAAAIGEPFRAFEQSDYDRYVDGKPRFEGVRSFLESRGIDLPEGSHDDPPGAESIGGLGNRKNELVLALIHDKGVQPYEGSVRYIHAVIAAGLKRAVVSSSTNCRDVLAAAGLADLFDTIIDGHVAEQRHLRGKPAPTRSSRRRRSSASPQPTPRCSRMPSPALRPAGREASGYVVGVDRVGQADALKAHGADIVVLDLAELLDS